MHCSRLFTSAAALLATSACTHLETRPDYSTARFDEAASGIPYALPALRYRLGITSSISACPTVTTFAGPEVSDGGFTLDTKVVPTATYVPGERYIANYDALTSPFKTSSFAIENYPSGVLKSINVSAQDQSGPLIRDAVSIALSVAGLAGKTQLLPPVAVPTSMNENFVSAAQLNREIANLLKDNTHFVVLCKADTIADLAALAVAKSLRDTEVSGLEQATKVVVISTTVNASRRANRDDLIALKTALEAQDKAQKSASDAKDGFDKAKAKLSLAADAWWPKSVVGSPGASADLSQEAQVDERELQDLARKIEIRAMPVITKDRFATWWNSLSTDYRQAFVTYYPELAKHYDAKADQPFQVIDTADTIVCSSEQTPVQCLAEQFTYRGALTLLDQPASDPDAPLTKVTSKAGGIFVRSPQKADFTLCPIKKPDCAKANEVAFEAGVSAPQFGQLRFLPFRNRVFETAALSLSMREDGSVERFSYDRTKALATEAAAAAKDAVDQYAAYRDKQDKKATDSVTAARAEEITSIQHQIDVLNKQKELTKAQAPDTPDADAAIKAETASIAASVALLDAKLSRLKAEAALAQASSGGSGGE